LNPVSVPYEMNVPILHDEWSITQSI
jgi:hypothetical protein